VDVITKPCGFSGEKNDTRAGFFPSNFMSFVSIIYLCYKFIRNQYMKEDTVNKTLLYYNNTVGLRTT